MSKQKVHEVETEGDVTEKPVEQSELEGISSTEEKPVKEEDPAEKTVIETEKVAAVTVKTSKKMGVYKFLSLYPQDIYIETLLKFHYPHSFFTKEEWFEKIDDVKKTPVNN